MTRGAAAVVSGVRKQVTSPSPPTLAQRSLRRHHARRVRRRLLQSQQWPRQGQPVSTM